MNHDVQILQSDSLDSMLLHKGYVVIPFLPSTQVETLKSLFYDLHPHQPEGFYATAHVQDCRFSNRISDALLDVFRPHVERIFYRGNPLGGSLLSKAPGENGVLPPHQDWNIVDETQYRSFNIWVPLVNTNEENGAIQIIPGSHQWLQTIRGPNIPSAFRDVMSPAWAHMQMLPMMAGDALIYDHRLLHASAQNQSRELRLSAVLAIMPQQAELKYYYRQDDQIECFASSVDFFLGGRPDQGPAGLPSEGLIDYDFPLVTETQFQSFCQRQTEPERSVFKRLLARLTPRAHV